MRIVFIIPVLLLLLSKNVYSKERYVLARAPQLAPTVMSKLWTPFVKYLSKEIGAEIILKVYSSRPEFEKDIVRGKIDFYFGNPGYGVVGYVKHGYVPLVRSSRKLLEGIVVVKKDGPINDISQLSGKTISFPSKNAFAASLLIRYQLSSQFKLKYTSQFSGGHDNSYRSVLVGNTAAAGGVVRTLERENEGLKSQLKIIYRTPGIKSHPFMAHPRVPLKVQKAISESILKLDETDSGKKLLKSVKISAPVKSNYKDDYSEIEAFALDSYRDLIE